MHPTALVILQSSVALLLLSSTACHHDTPAPAQHVAGKPAATPAPNAPSEQDLQIARHALSIRDVVAQLRAGVPKEKVLADVKQRRITTLLVEANELELAANGAGHELLAALKDPHNLLTPVQETAYMQLVALHVVQPPLLSAKSRR